MMKAKTIRNAQIVADAGEGMSLNDMVRKYQLGRDYLQKLATGYIRQDRVQQVVYTVYDGSELYADRDKEAIMMMACHHGAAGRLVSADWSSRKGLS